MSTFSIDGEGNFQKEGNFSELGESPIHPEFISFQLPIKSGIDPHTHIKLGAPLALAKIRWLHLQSSRSPAREFEDSWIRAPSGCF